jgi:hypothetical protein
MMTRALFRNVCELLLVLAITWNSEWNLRRLVLWGRDMNVIPEQLKCWVFLAWMCEAGSMSAPDRNYKIRPIRPHCYTVTGLK